MTNVTQLITIQKTNGKSLDEQQTQPIDLTTEEQYTIVTVRDQRAISEQNHNQTRRQENNKQQLRCAEIAKHNLLRLEIKQIDSETAQ